MHNQFPLTEETKARFQEVMTREALREITLQLLLGDLFILVSLIQLSLRHPSAGATPSAGRARQILAAIRDIVIQVDPVLGAVIDAGDDPAQDAPAADPPSGVESVDPAHYKLAKAAVAHVLNAISDDPRKYWLMGYGTGSWEKLTAAAAALFGKPVQEIRESFQPRKEAYDGYLRQKESDEELLEYCQENGLSLEYLREHCITAKP